jgi:hypothetical protein
VTGQVQAGVIPENLLILAAAISDAFERWHVKVDSRGWHAWRAGDFLASADNRAVHSVHADNPGLLLLQLDYQDRIDCPDSWSFG